ncbi:hypothetical protein GGS21DRAFT_492699 [Xylaria nigripes]|nr:hypothetical protein GGS21DRAFT_494456 [Xylaria nigripes]KAI2628377.1 hypothetical protein GGS21DRAFT_492699 [Xylaria nigripes]
MAAEEASDPRASHCQFDIKQPDAGVMQPKGMARNRAHLRRAAQGGIPTSYNSVPPVGFARQVDAGAMQQDRRASN